MFIYAREERQQIAQQFDYISICHNDHIHEADGIIGAMWAEISFSQCERSGCHMCNIENSLAHAQYLNTNTTQRNVRR